MILKEQNKTNAYVRLEPCRSQKEVENLNLNLNNLAARKSQEFVEMYFENEKVNKKRTFVDLDFKKTYKARYGMMVRVLLPEEVHTNPMKLKQLTTRLMDFIIDREKGLKYCWKIKKTKIGYNRFMYMLVIWCCDREYYPHTEILKYKRDGWINRHTKAFTKKGDENAILLYQKGQIKGTKEMLFKARKTRLFSFGSIEAFSHYIETLKDYYLMLLEEVMGLKAHKGIIFRRHNLRKAYNRYIRRIMLANNRTRKYVQNKLNHLLVTLKYHFGSPPWEAMKLHENNIPIEEYTLPRRIQEAFEKLVDKYRNIFKVDSFYYQNELFTIYQGHSDEVEKNIDVLLKIAKEEINGFEQEIRLNYLFNGVLEIN